MTRDQSDDDNGAKSPQTSRAFGGSWTVARHNVFFLPLAATLMLVSLVKLSEARDHGKPRDLNTITTIVIHSVGGPACIAGAVQFRPIPVRSDDADFWQRILKAAPSAEAHYVIGRTGIRAQVMTISEIANHTIGVNSISVGIELVNRGDGIEPFEEPQIQTLIETIKELRRTLPKISITNIVMHSDIDQRTCVCGNVIYRRRQDPGTNFPMQRVISEVRLPGEQGVGASTLPRLVGAAPNGACITFQH